MRKSKGAVFGVHFFLALALWISLQLCPAGHMQEQRTPCGLRATRIGEASNPGPRSPAADDPIASQPPPCAVAGGEHQTEYKNVPFAGGVRCSACTEWYKHGRKMHRCTFWSRFWCPPCWRAGKHAAAARPADGEDLDPAYLFTETELAAMEEAEGSDASISQLAADAPLPPAGQPHPPDLLPPQVELQEDQPAADASAPNMSQLLQGWAAEPALPTMMHVPRHLRKRFGVLAAGVLQRAVDLSTAQPASDADVQAARNAHLLAWALPGLILRQAPMDGDDEPDAARADSLRRAALVRQRLQIAERGQWHKLLEQALAERAEKGRDHDPLDTRQVRSRKLAQAIRKTRNGCYRTATQLLTGAGKAPQCEETIDKVWELCCGMPQPADAAAHQRACAAARRAPWTQIRRRIVNKRVKLARAGAVPGPSGWRNAHIRSVHESGDAGRATLHAWCQLWADGRAGPVADCWRQATIAALAKPNGGIRPISLQEALLKLAANVLAETQQAHLKQAVGERQFGVGNKARADVAALLLDVALEEEGVDGLLSLDVANAFGSLWHWAIYEAVTDLAPWMLPWLTDLWQLTGLVCWQKGAEGWVCRYAACGIPQGDPLAAWLYALTQRWLLERNEVPPSTHSKQEWATLRQQALQQPSLAYMDDVSLWGQLDHLGQTYSFYREALAEGGLQLKPEKCQLLAPQAIPGVPVQPATCITALGCSMHSDFEVAVALNTTTARSADWSTPATSAVEPPVEKRARQAELLAEALVEVALSGHPCAAHCAFVLGQRVLGPALDFDARVGDPSLVRPRLDRVNLAARKVLCASVGKVDLPELAWTQACLRGELAGFALRPPGRPGMHAAARWAAMRALTPLVTRAAATYCMQRPLPAVLARTVSAAVGLEEAGVDVSSGLPVLLPWALREVVAALPAHEELSRISQQPSRRLQGSASRLVELVTCARLWQASTPAARERLIAASGELAGTLFCDAAADTREGWLDDDEWRMHSQLQLGIIEVPIGARCQLVPATGPHAGQQCGRVLEQQVVHGSRCRAGEQRVRIHNGARHALATELKALGLVVDQEAPVPAWSQLNAKGQLVEAILDIQVRVPGSSIVVRVDLEAVHTEAKSHRGADPAALLLAASHVKHERYGPEVAPLVFALRGRLCVEALETLHLLASMAVSTAQIGPALVLRRLVRRIAVAAACAEARARLGALGGRCSAALVSNHAFGAAEA